MFVVATAGHVDHGKSTLVRALTGMEPDRWAQERRRGMTIDLGYAWTALASGAVVGFVDVPGHARFIGNMLAGVGPAPAVLLVVAADEGWRQQSAEHLAAVTALGVRAGLLVVTRSDLADPAPALAQARREIAGSSLGSVEAVAVSGATGAGIPRLREALDRLGAALPTPVTDGRVRLWVDRAFTIRGSGTVVTGTLGGGTLAVGQELDLGGRPVRIRGLQSLGRPYDSVAAVARVAVNLRGVDRTQVRRGDALLTPAAWHRTGSVDVRLTADDVPGEAVLHVGSAAVPVRVRPLAAGLARLTLGVPLPLNAGDRGVLRDPGGRRLAAGALVLDADPPPLSRRGAGAARGRALAGADATPDLGVEVARRGAVRSSHLMALGVPVGAETVTQAGVLVEGEWLVDPAHWAGWLERLGRVAVAHAASRPLDLGLPEAEAARSVGLPDPRLLTRLVTEAGLEQADGRIRRPGTSLLVVAGIERLHERLVSAPFAAPEQPELDALGLGRREIAAALSAGRLLRLPGDVLLLPDAPARAMRVLAVLTQPFTTSAARQALGTTRRVAIPLLEHLDGKGWTRRVDQTSREVVR